MTRNDGAALISVRTALVVLPLLTLSACSGGGGDASPTPTSTCDFNAKTVPANCVTEGPTTTFPTDPAKIAMPVPRPVKGRLGGDDNANDPTKNSGSFTVVVPKGQRVGSVITCLGNGEVKIATSPSSKAEQTISCDADPTLASELEVEDDVVLKADTTYAVTVTVTKATRWSVAVFGTTAPLGQGQG